MGDRSTRGKSIWLVLTLLAIYVAVWWGLIRVQPGLFVLYALFGVWVLIDGNRRETNVLPWAISTATFGPLVLPVYIARRPLRPGEVREGGAAWNILKSFAILWTIAIGFAAANYFFRGETSVSRTPIGITVGIVGFGVVWFFPVTFALILGLLLRKNSIVERGPTGALTAAQPPSSPTPSRTPALGETPWETLSEVDRVLGRMVKKCPQCAEEVKFEAIVCRYCGHRFDAHGVRQRVQDVRDDLSRATTRGRPGAERPSETDLPRPTQRRGVDGLGQGEHERIKVEVGSDQAVRPRRRWGRWVGAVVLAVIGLAILSRNDSGVGPAPGSRPASQPEPVDGRNAAPALAPSRSDEKRKLLAYSDCSKKFEGKLRESLDGFFDCLQEQGIPEPRRGDVRYRAELVAHEECLEQTQKQERILAYDDCMIARGFPEAVPSRDPKYRQEMERIDAESAAMEECYQQTGFRGPLVLPSQLPLAQALANCMADAGHPSLKEDFDRLADDPEARARFFALLQAMEDYKFCSRDVGGDTQAMKACMDSLGSRWARRTGQ